MSYPKSDIALRSMLDVAERSIRIFSKGSAEERAFLVNYEIYDMRDRLRVEWERRMAEKAAERAAAAAAAEAEAAEA